MIFNELSEKELAYLSRSFVVIRGKNIDDIAYLANNDRSVLVYTKDHLDRNVDPIRITNRDIKKYEFSSPPLGYFYYPSLPSRYLERIPHRRWVLGVCGSNISNGMLPRIGESGIISLLRSIKEKNFPDYETAIKESSDRWSTVAISRNYAISQGNLLEYKGRVLGEVSKKIEVSSEKERMYHEVNIGSLTNGRIEFVFKKEKEIDYDNDDL